MAKLTIDRKTARKWREAEFLSCFLMGLGFGMIAETSNGIDSCVAALILAASLAMMVSARDLRETIGDVA
jgi:hypothetical protein